MQLPAKGSRRAAGALHRRRKISADRRGLLLAGVGGAALTVVAAILAWPANAEPNMGDIRGDAAGAVNGSYVVVLKNTVSGASVDSTTDNLNRRYGGRVGHRYSSALRGFEVDSLDEDSARELAADPSVSFVQRNTVLTAADTQANPPSWGLDRIDQRDNRLDSTFNYPNAASNVHAYVIDSGVRVTHQEFGGRAVSGIDTVDNDNDASDCNGHGTHVAGTLGGKTTGVAKSVQIVAVRVLDCNANGTTATVIAGVDWVTAHAIRPAVANLSISGDGDNAVDNAVANSIASGITYGVAAGNDNGSDACTRSPARLPQAITVGSSNQYDRRSSFSNVGSCVDIFAPGTSITSAWNTSDTQYIAQNGTSMATPHVVGAAALVLAASPGLSPAQVTDALLSDATSNALSGIPDGTPNKLVYVDNTPPAPPSPTPTPSASATGAASPTPSATPSDFSIAATPGIAVVALGGTLTGSVDTTVVSGDAQSVSVRVSGLPSGATATVDPATITAGSSAKLTITTNTLTPLGVYTVTVTGTSATTSHTATITLTVAGVNTSGCTATNDKDVAIPDAGAAVYSDILIANCDRTASDSSTAEVHIKHSYRGDLKIDLVGPDGTIYKLKAADVNDDGVNVDTIYKVNLSGKAANGTWRLKVQDMYAGDSGTIDTWTLKL
jgi:subtilisin family serine protease/subtilisin-like proprotein convertase family protein